MVSAAVGFQCPACVRSGNKGVRQARTAFGGRSAGTGVLTKAVIAINVVVFLAAQVSRDDVVNGLVLRAFITFRDGDGVAEGGFYRLLSAAFLHEQVWHILLNMVVLYMFGTQLERLLGPLRFAGLYLLCALGGSTASYLFNDPRVGSLGASGAVFGLVGALLVIERRHGAGTPGMVVLVGILLLPGFVIPGIDWRSHLGGLVTGAVLGAVFAYAPRARRSLVQLGSGVAVLAVLVALVAYRTAELRSQFGL